jgi:predicted transcriptional regulator
MSKTVTLRLDDPVYRLFKDVAEREHRPLSNFIETAVLRFMQEHETVDEFEMAEIRGNVKLNQSLKRGHQDAKRRRGSFV